MPFLYNVVLDSGECCWLVGYGLWLNDEVLGSGLRCMDLLNIIAFLGGYVLDCKHTKFLLIILHGLDAQPFFCAILSGPTVSI